MDCVNHPGVAGIGVCVSCRRVVCDLCSTRLQGRNFCSRCLESRAGALPVEPGLRSAAGPRIAMGLAVALSAMVLVASTWLLGFLLYLAG